MGSLHIHLLYPRGRKQTLSPLSGRGDEEEEGPQLQTPGLLSMNHRNMAYLMFFSSTLLFCKCAVATGQWCPSIRSPLSLSLRYISIISKEQDWDWDIVLTSSFIFYSLCPLQLFSAKTAESLQ